VGAVTKMLRPSGDRVKTDRRDADFLARMLAVGNVVECWCPAPAQEADRDLSRLREQVRERPHAGPAPALEVPPQEGARLPRAHDLDAGAQAVAALDRAPRAGGALRALRAPGGGRQRRGAQEARRRRDREEGGGPRARPRGRRALGIRGVSTLTAFSLDAELRRPLEVPGRPRPSCPTSGWCPPSPRRASR
jgi:hypothetical protein